MFPVLGIYDRIEAERGDGVADDFFNNRQRIDLSTPRETL